MSSDDDDQGSFSPSRRILLISIISLLVITILVFILHLYSRYLQQRQLREIRRRRSTLNRIINSQIAPEEPNFTDYPPNIGLNPSVIESLPRLVYKKTTNFQNSESISECSVCLGNIVDQDLVRVLPNCKHMFHVECVDMWLGSNTTCPICRTMVEPTKAQTEQNESGPDQAQAQPSAPPMDQESDKGSGSGLRISSFRRMLSRDKSSSTRVQSCADEGFCVEDLERQ